MQNSQSMSKAQRLTLLGLMTALVVVLQLLGQFIRFGPFAVSLVLIPIVVGAALDGPLAGGWLGFVFGVVVLFTDAAGFLAISIPGTVFTVLVKGVAAGVVAGVVYRLLEKKKRWLAILAAAVVCPVVNTGVFFAGCYLFFFDALSVSAAEAGKSVFLYIILVMIGANFLFELLFNLLLSPAVLRVTALGEKIFQNRKR